MKRQQNRFTDEEKAWIKKNSTLPGNELHAKFCFKFGKPDVNLSSIIALRTRMGWPTSRTKTAPTVGRPKKFLRASKKDSEYYQKFPPMEWAGGTYKIGKFGFLFRLDTDSGCFVKSNSDREAYLRFLDDRAKFMDDLMNDE